MAYDDWLYNRISCFDYVTSWIKKIKNKIFYFNDQWNEALVSATIASPSVITLNHGNYLVPNINEVWDVVITSKGLALVYSLFNIIRLFEILTVILSNLDLVLDGIH